jgi:hypothetical protein
VLVRTHDKDGTTSGDPTRKSSRSGLMATSDKLEVFSQIAHVLELMLERETSIGRLALPFARQSTRRFRELLGSEEHVQDGTTRTGVCTKFLRLFG